MEKNRYYFCFPYGLIEYQGLEEKDFQGQTLVYFKMFTLFSKEDVFILEEDLENKIKNKLARPIVSKNKAQEILDHFGTHSCEDQFENWRKRKEFFEKSFHKGDLDEIAQTLVFIFKRNKNSAVGFSDKSLYQKLLFNFKYELAFALEQDPEYIENLLAEKLEQYIQ